MSTTTSTDAAHSVQKHIAGGVLWALSIQYFIIEFIAQRAWGTPPYSLHLNSISDLGATTCATIPILGTIACSPLHSLMNASFILSGVLTIAGLYFVRSAFPKEWAVSLATWFITLGAMGVIGVGLIPEDKNIVLHLVCALAFFIFSNVGILLLGIALYRCSWRRNFATVTAILGAVGLASFIMIPFSVVLGIGIMERFVAYPITIWVILAGVLFLMHPPLPATHHKV